MTNTTRTAAALLAALLTVAGLTAATPTARAETPIDKFIDCTDAFWSIACGLEPPTLETVELRSPFTWAGVTCRLVPAHGTPDDFDYLPPRGECVECYTVTVYRGRPIASREVCEPWPA